MDPTVNKTPVVYESSHPAFPPRMFAIGEEPLGIRVTPYHKPSCISRILNALDPSEIEIVKGSPFGKLVEIAEQPPFSGRFGRFLISRQLKVAKKHEVWFLFAGKPIRFSIREFALVTGLNCRNFPLHSKKRSKKTLSEKPYWGELFGSMKDVHVSYVISMLKKKTVTDPQIRIKYAMLALLASVILPTLHSPRISQESAERIKEIDQFYAYPIKERNVVSLSQNTVALKGFVLSIVLIEAVPSLIGVVQEGGASSSEGDSHDDEKAEDEREGTKSVNPVRVHEIDSACKAEVLSIISSGVERTNVTPDLGWSDDEEDVLVDNLVNSIQEGFSFSNSHFRGGVSKAEVIIMREESKKENLSRKTAKTQAKQPVSDSLDAEYVASLVQKAVSGDLMSMGEQIKNLGVSFLVANDIFRANIETILETFRGEMIKMMTTPCTRPHISPVGNGQTDNLSSSCNRAGGSPLFDAGNIIREAVRYVNKDNVVALDHNIVFPNPTFSLGLTQEDALITIYVDDGPAMGNRKSKRPKLVPRELVGDYQCDKRLLSRAWEAHVNATRPSPTVDYGVKFSALSVKLQSPFVFLVPGLSIDSRDLTAIVERSSHLSAKVIDTLIHHTRSVFQSNSEYIHMKNYVFLDTKSVSLLAKSFAKFSKASKKESFKFPPALFEFADCPIGDGNRFYVPFNFDRKHWVGVCVDMSLSQVIVLDCNNALRTDGMITKELRPIAHMFPYLLRQAGKNIGAKDLKALTIDRPRSVPQN
ncbi:hypothetical protein N665_0104s0344 [Sinapis alba]|nr:hypothetical protein N665_0104s0344 [Sinapis alba]